MEIMWDYNFYMSIFRGVIQGLTRGFYKSYSYQLPDNCFGRESVEYLYYIVESFSALEFEPIV
jgi:hypothetical protein